MPLPSKQAAVNNIKNANFTPVFGTDIYAVTSARRAAAVKIYLLFCVDKGKKFIYNSPKGCEQMKQWQIMQQREAVVGENSGAPATKLPL